MDELGPVAQLHVRRAVDALSDEFEGVHSRATVDRVMNDSVSQLAGSAEVDDFVATLAHRFTRERLKALARRLEVQTEQTDVLFVGLGDTGRGQIASALTVLRSDGLLVAHSAGSTAATDVDSSVVAVMQELGVDLSEAYAKPLSQEVLEGADIVVTMGRSVGAIDVPQSTLHLDWRVGDPTGAPIDEVRRVRDDIDRRVQELVESMASGSAAAAG
jgi:arsenate reductase (thioredoxin)